MAKKSVKPDCFMAPIPAALISCADSEGNENLLTVAWTGIINSAPPMAYISVRPERFSHHMISETGEFVINLTTKDMMRAVDACGIRSGRNTDKWKLSGFTKAEALAVRASVVAESPVNIECKVKQTVSLGSHDMFLAEIVGVQADEKCFDEFGSFKMTRAGLAAYVQGSYVELGNIIGTMGFSARRKDMGDRRKEPGKAALPIKK